MAEGRERKEWNRLSHLMALLATINRDVKKHRNPFDAKEFNPFEKQTRTTKGIRLGKGNLRILKQVFVK